MGCWDVWCPLCGCPYYNYDSYKKNGLKYYDDDWSIDYKKFLKEIKMDWLFKTTILLKGKKAQHNFKETGCNTVFSKGDISYDLHPDELIKEVPVHTDCWK